MTPNFNARTYAKAAMLAKQGKTKSEIAEELGFDPKLFDCRVFGYDPQVLLRYARRASKAKRQEIHERVRRKIREG